MIDWATMILLAVPLILLNLAVMIPSLIDWARRRQFPYLDRWVWLLLILFVQFLGPILYLTLVGKHERN